MRATGGSRSTTRRDTSGRIPSRILSLTISCRSDLARSLSAAFPGPDEISWVVRDNENNRRRYQHDETRLPTLLREMLRELNSRQFVLFIETRPQRRARGRSGTYWMVTAVFDRDTGLRTDMVAAVTAAENVATRPFFPPLSSLPAYADSPDATRAANSNPVSYDLAKRAINLPSALTLTEDQVDRVCSVIRSL
jgi:dTDP-4-amino-4,6-dideoxygalactose transaminase